MGPLYHIYAFGHGGPAQIFRKIAVAKLANKRLVAYQGPGADPGEDVGGAPLTSHFQQSLSTGGYISFKGRTPITHLVKVFANGFPHTYY